MSTYKCRISGVHPRRRPHWHQEIKTALLINLTPFITGWAAGIVTYCIIHIIVK